MKKLIILLSFLIFGCAAKNQQQGGKLGYQIKIDPQAIAKVNSPNPPANAEQKTSIGRGRATINIQNSPTDTDPYWTDKIDVDDDGDDENAELLWDDKDKILFISYVDIDVCKDGGRSLGSALIGLYGAGNPRKMPVGSGFYVVELNKGFCGAKEDGLWGCRIDANGNPTTCGIAVLDQKNKDISIVKASE